MGKISNLTNIFQWGWNHQLVIVFQYIQGCCGLQKCCDTVDRRNPANQLRLVVYPTIYKVLYIHPRWCRISSINSTTAGENAVNPIRYGTCFNAFTVIGSYSVFLIPNWLPSLTLPAHPWKWAVSKKERERIFGWWFQIFFICTPTWGRFPFWLIFFKGVETTNQIKSPFATHFWGVYSLFVVSCGLSLAQVVLYVFQGHSVLGKRSGRLVPYFQSEETTGFLLDVFLGFFSGVIKWDPFWGDHFQCKCMVTLRDFPYIIIVHWLGW